MLVKVIRKDDKILNEEMKYWISEHEGVVYKVEKEDDTCFKLFGIGFWISKDLTKSIV